jgi:hypothetical protein
MPQAPSKEKDPKYKQKDKSTGGKPKGNEKSPILLHIFQSRYTISQAGNLNILLIIYHRVAADSYYIRVKSEESQKARFG